MAKALHQLVSVSLRALHIELVQDFVRLVVVTPWIWFS